MHFSHAKETKFHLDEVTFPMRGSKACANGKVEIYKGLDDEDLICDSTSTLNELKGLPAFDPRGFASYEQNQPMKGMTNRAPTGLINLFTITLSSALVIKTII